VARQGLADVSRGDGKVTLKLKSGVEAPVSRANLKVVREAGWL
jgi:DNA-binding LytR/AlgR family response regulator